MLTTNKRNAKKASDIFRLAKVAAIVIALALTLTLSALSLHNLVNVVTKQYGALVNLEIGRTCYDYDQLLYYNMYQTCVCEMCLRVFWASRIPERACVLVGLETKKKYNIEFVCVDAKKHRWLFEV